MKGEFFECSEQTPKKKKVFKEHKFNFQLENFKCKPFWKVIEGRAKFDLIKHYTTWEIVDLPLQIKNKTNDSRNDWKNENEKPCEKLTRTKSSELYSNRAKN